MKSREELTALKEEVEALNKKLAELTENEMELVSGGGISTYMACPCGYRIFWLGTFKDQVFDCKSCGKHSLTGIYVID